MSFTTHLKPILPTRPETTFRQLTLNALQFLLLETTALKGVGQGAVLDNVHSAARFPQPSTSHLRFPAFPLSAFHSHQPSAKHQPSANNQPSTLNCPRIRCWAFDVGCWMLDVPISLNSQPPASPSGIIENHFTASAGRTSSR